MKSLGVLQVANGGVRVQYGKIPGRARACTRAGSERVVHGNCSLVQAERRSKLRVEALCGDVAERSQGPARRPTTQCAKKVCFRKPGSISLDGDVQIVLQCQVNRVLQADAQLAVLDHLLDAGRVGKNWLGNLRRRVRSDDIGEPPLAVRVILIRYLNRPNRGLRLGLRRRRGLSLRLLGEGRRYRRKG